jgi:hypothetical protein
MPNIISDIAGQYHTLMDLLKKMPDDETISIGDMVDRGHDSDKVLKWFMKNGKAIMGNHEHMMLDYYRNGLYYSDGIWDYNGGWRTQESFQFDVPEEILTWIEFLPKYLEIDGNLISHSFIYPEFSIQEACDLGKNSMSLQADRCIIWNRCEPERIDKYKLQIAGHNSQWGLRRFSDEKGEYAICLDDSRKKKLTGIHLPSMQIYQQDYSIY